MSGLFIVFQAPQKNLTQRGRSSHDANSEAESSESVLPGHGLAAGERREPERKGWVVGNARALGVRTSGFRRSVA